MSLWYRAHQSANKQEVFSGEGGLFTAGRWHYRGHKVIYCSQSIALCTLEWLAHHGLSVSGFNYFRYAIDIPKRAILTVKSAELPKNWRTTPSSDVTREFAQTLLFESKKIWALSVPSVLIPEEYNLVINPLHPGFGKAKLAIQEMGKYIAPAR